MARRASSAKKTLKRVAGAVKSTAKKVTSKVTSRLRPVKKEAKPASASTTRKNAQPVAASSRKRRIESDVSPEVLNKTYTPTQTNLRGPFRSSGADQQRDQDLAGGFSDERWKDEDKLTNKSGDPRIGTHKRKYEPGE